jgi:CRISPR-associated protein Csd2
MGRKFTIPYGLYKGFGYISPALADPERHGTSFSEDDLALFKNALNMMFENDHSAARGRMSPVRCIAFKHADKLGNARADQLFSLIRVELKPEVRANDRPARSKDDYEVTIDSAKLPAGVTIEEWVS